MPKIELKSVQTELEKGIIWPFYWVYGSERLKSRELLKRIRIAVLGNEGARSEWGEDVFEGSDSNASDVLDSILSPTLLMGVKLVIVKDAHLLKNSELLAEVLGPARKKSELNSVCVCLSRDLDARKKFSKILLEGAAVVPCEEVGEAQKGAWIQYLAKRRGLELNPALVLKLSAIDPWSLDIIDQELEKYAVAGSTADVILEGFGQAEGTDVFLDRFFRRDLNSALPLVSQFAENPEDALPLLGLFAWNVRQLAVMISDREQGTRNAKLNPYMAEQFRKWSQAWRLEELIELQSELEQIDFCTKQTPLLPLGLWTHLVTRFCHS